MQPSNLVSTVAGIKCLVKNHQNKERYRVTVKLVYSLTLTTFCSNKVKNAFKSILYISLPHLDLTVSKIVNNLSLFTFSRVLPQLFLFKHKTSNLPLNKMPNFKTGYAFLADIQTPCN